jgi:hypothetical protein
MKNEELWCEAKPRIVFTYHIPLANAWVLLLPEEWVVGLLK